MKCSKCNKEYSPKVLRIHERTCSVDVIKSVDVITSEDNIRQLAKEKGIKSWHNKKIENIKKELGDI